MLSIKKLRNASMATPVDFRFIKYLADVGTKIRMVDYESINAKTTLATIFGKAKYVAILFHIIINGKATPIGHWCLLLKGSPIRFFDSLGLGLHKILKLTHEEPHLLKLLGKRKWENSNHRLQTQGSHFKECGCFVGLRARFGSLSNTQFVKFIRSGGKPDETAVMLALLHYISFYAKNK